MNPCRACGNKQVIKFLDLCSTPLANSFLTREQLNEPEPRFPLDVVFCSRCGLVQLNHEVAPEILFSNYIYVSSTSQTMPAHFDKFADEVVARFTKSSEDLVVEIGSNDGCLLRAFTRNKVRSLGIEPASNIAAIANREGLETVNDFFCERSARTLRTSHGRASVVIGNNVLAHIGHLGDFLAGLDVLLEAEGVAIFEVPYLVDLLDKCEFDTIYHEHLSYFSVASLQNLFRMKGMRIFDVKRLPVHGGTIRIYIGREGSGPAPLPSVQEMLASEKAAKLGLLETYEAFAKRVAVIKSKTRALLSELKTSGVSIAAYGAPAKGNTLLNYFQIGNDIIDFVVDRSPHKQGMYTPGSHIPVLSPEALLDEQPNYVLVLAWNFIDEIMKQQSEYLNRGGKFIVPIPEPKVICQSESSVESAANVNR
jgi:hypothetical protein